MQYESNHYVSTYLARIRLKYSIYPWSIKWPVNERKQIFKPLSFSSCRRIKLIETLLYIDKVLCSISKYHWYCRRAKKIEKNPIKEYIVCCISYTKFYKIITLLDKNFITFEIRLFARDHNIKIFHRLLWWSATS